MKQILPVILLFIASGSFAQAGTDTIPPYLRSPNIPSFRILLDDSTWFTNQDLPKNKPVVFIYFSPECHHCQMTANAFVPKMDELKDIFLLWVCYHTPQQIKDFANDYKLAGYDNIKLGKDVSYFFPPYYKITYTPFIVAYDKNGKMLQAYEGGTDPDTLIKLFNK